MIIHARTRDRAVQTSQPILQFLLKHHRPRDYAFRFWDGSVWEAEAGQPTCFAMMFHHLGALRHMSLSPSEHALGRAHMCDDFDVEWSVGVGKGCHVQRRRHLLRNA